jgi:hypothetical protein
VVADISGRYPTDRPFHPVAVPVVGKRCSRCAGLDLDQQVLGIVGLGMIELHLSGREYG